LFLTFSLSIRVFHFSLSRFSFSLLFNASSLFLFLDHSLSPAAKARNTL